MAGQVTPTSTTPAALEHAVALPPDPPPLSLADLDGDHRRLLDRAISRILSTEIAEITYAQIIDGLPTGRVVRDHRSQPHTKHPIWHAYWELWPGMLEKARAFSHDLRPETLRFSSKVSSVSLANGPSAAD